MPSTFTRYALLYQIPYRKAEATQTLLKLKRIVFCFILCICCSNAVVNNALANDGLILKPIAPMTVYYGKPFVYQFEPGSIEPENLRVRLINKPQNAVLATNAEGLPVFLWTPRINVLPTTVVIVQAFDVRNKNKISTQRMVLQKGPYAANTTESVTDAPNLIESEPAVVDAGSVQLSKATTASTELTKPIGEASTAASTSGVARTFVNEAASKQAELVPAKPSQLVSGQAPQLAALDTQALTVGVEFQLFIRPIDSDGDALSLSVKGLPLGAELRNVSSGSWMLKWRPEASQAGEHRLMLMAIENTAAALQTERVLTLDVHDPNAQTRLVLASATSPQSNLELNEGSGGGSADKRSVITFEPLSSQIVSAGHTINLPIVSRVGENRKTILHVDRLPSGATFDLNDDGTRTFHWRTTNADQGEHVFRFTAVNPRDASQILNKELLIVVGDPAAQGSMPQ